MPKSKTLVRSVYSRITSYNVCYTKLLRHLAVWTDDPVLELVLGSRFVVRRKRAQDAITVVWVNEAIEVMIDEA